MNQHQLPAYKLTENYFISTIVHQLKTYVMLQLSYLTRATKVRSNEEFTNISFVSSSHYFLVIQDFLRFHKIARDQRVSFNTQYGAFTDQSEKLMWELSRIVWTCDNFTSNDSYTQLTNFIQGYVDNEINLSPDGSCVQYCSDFKKTKNYGCKSNTLCGANYLDHNKTLCEGTVRDCDYFGPTFSYCPNVSNK